MSSQFFFSLITGIFVGGAAGYLGSLMVTRRMALVGDALGHVALPGMGLALLLGFDVSLGAFAFLLLGIFLVWFFESRTPVPSEALVGIVFVASLAAGFLLVPQPEILEALFGDISAVTASSAFFAVISSLAVFLAVKKIYPAMMLASISEDLAKAQGINVRKHNFIYLLFIATIVALGIKITGSLLIGALVIVPAAAARNFCSSLAQYSAWSIFFGALSALLGTVIYKFSGLPAGPMMVLSSVAFFAATFIFKKL